MTSMNNENTNEGSIKSRNRPQSAQSKNRKISNEDNKDQVDYCTAYFSDRKVNESNDDTKRNSDQSPKSNSDAVVNNLKEFSEKLKNEKYDFTNNTKLKVPENPQRAFEEVSNRDIKHYHTNIQCNRKTGFCLSFLTLCIQSCHIGFVFSLQAAFTIIYLDDGLDIKYKNILNLIGQPFMLTPFWGVMIDVNYIKCIGKSKTYLVIMPCIYSAILAFLSFYIEEWIKSKNIWPFFGCYIVITICLSIYMTAMDGWISTLFEEEMKPKGSYGRFLGQGLGSFTAYNVLVLLNSDKWCIKYLSRDRKLIDMFPFVMGVAIFCFTSACFILLFISEKVTTHQKVSKISDIWKAFKSLIKKPMMKRWFFLALFKTFGIDAIVQVLSTVLVSEGLDKEILIMAHTISGIPVLLGTLILYKFQKKGRLYRMIYWILWFGILIAAQDFYTYFDYKKNGDKNTLYFSIASDVFGGWTKTALFILECAQISIMCDEKLNATAFATLQLIYNLSNAIPYQLGTLLISFLSYYIWGIFCFAFAIGFQVTTKRQFNKIDDAKKEDFVFEKLLVEKKFDEEETDGKTLKEKIILEVLKPSRVMNSKKEVLDQSNDYSDVKYIQEEDNSNQDNLRESAIIKCKKDEKKAPGYYTKANKIFPRDEKSETMAKMNKSQVVKSSSRSNLDSIRKNEYAISLIEDLAKTTQFKNDKFMTPDKKRFRDNRRGLNSVSPLIETSSIKHDIDDLTEEISIVGNQNKETPIRKKQSINNRDLLVSKLTKQANVIKESDSEVDLDDSAVELNQSIENSKFYNTQGDTFDIIGEKDTNCGNLISGPNMTLYKTETSNRTNGLSQNHIELSVSSRSKVRNNPSIHKKK